MKLRFAAIGTLAILGIGVVAPGSAALAEDFYRGKTIQFIVGYAPGGGYDTYTRAIARHLGRHIPGDPGVVVVNMEGAGSLLAANFLYSKTDPDGLTIGVFNSGMVTQAALGSRGVRFDARKFGWVGSPVKGTPTCAVMGFTGLKTLEDVLRTDKELKFGATRAGASTDDLPKLMNALMGTHFNVISGYKGTSRIRVALQSREVDAVCFGWESMRVTARSMLDAKGDDKLIPFVVHGKSRDPEVKDLPQFTHVIKGEENLAAFRAWVNQFEFQRPLALPPDTPSDRIATLRKVFKATLEDREFLADTEKSQLLIEYVSGREIEEYVDQILSVSPSIKQKLQFLVTGNKIT
jgi:tripartite-type tricarboxylate transporter receptor subunit TctC